MSQALLTISALAAAVALGMLWRTRQSLQDSERRFQSLVEKLPVVTYVAAVDPIGRLQYASPQMEEIFGFPLETWLNEPFHWLNQLEPEDRDRTIQAIEDLPRDGKPVTVEYRRKAPDGRTD